MLSFVSPLSQAESGAEPELRKRLISALADISEKYDRYDMAVWTADFEQRLRPFLKRDRDRLQLLEHVYIESQRANLDAALVLAVIEVESHFDRYAISEAGARGLMQIMPFWSAEIGNGADNLFQLETNLRFGCTILRYYLDREKGDLTRALARYNGSLGRMTYPNKVYKALDRHWRG